MTIETEDTWVPADEPGRITTFYSFKGGVGRSMALANVAFLAAMNRRRVLVMDWDLEAPGLGYYFRGLMEPQDARALKKAPGILDAAWEWVAKIRETKEGKELNEFVGRFVSGFAFDDMVQSLLDDEMVDSGYTLDILSAGSDQIGGSIAYEEALALFSWPTFFSADAGGIMLDALRNWAKERYDIILVDSRTGLADVAGICTMQLPDEVALCFILNRQNMEGVARVAGAVRAKRAEEVKLRVVPMRLASRGTSEEADALARARRELTMYGGFSGDAVDEDVRALAIEASPNVPFYETIATITAMDPSTDPLSLHYLRLTQGLFGLDFGMPILPDEWTERVRSRLKPSHASPEYLLKLQSSVPERAFGEILHLVEVALDAQLEHDADLEDEYVDALVRAAFLIADAADTPYDGVLLLGQVADLVRARIAEHGLNWESRLVEALSKLLEYHGYIEDGEELALLEELEALLSSDPTIAARLTRLRYRRRVARLHLENDDGEAAFQTIAEITQLIGSLQQNDLSADQLLAVQTAEADTYLLRGDAYYLASDTNMPSAGRAAQEFIRGHALRQVRERSELARFRFEFAFRLATRFPKEVDSEKRALYALEAAQASSGQSYGSIVFVELAEPLIANQRERAVRLQRFIEATIGADRVSTLVTLNSRQPRSATRFFETAAQITEILSIDRPQNWQASVRELGRVCVQVGRQISRRRATMSTRGHEEPMAKALQHLERALAATGSESVGELREIAAMLHHRPRYSSRPRDDRGGNYE